MIDKEKCLDCINEVMKSITSTRKRTNIWVTDCYVPDDEFDLITSYGLTQYHYPNLLDPGWLVLLCGARIKRLSEISK